MERQQEQPDADAPQGDQAMDQGRKEGEARQQQAALRRLTLIVAAINLVLNINLIPFAGIHGAAAATAMSTGRKTIVGAVGVDPDSLLAVKELVFDRRRCTMDGLLQALRDNWQGHETLQAWARFRAPKYGRDDDAADGLAYRVMRLWTDLTWQHTTASTGRGPTSGRTRVGLSPWKARCRTSWSAAGRAST